LATTCRECDPLVWVLRNTATPDGPVGAMRYGVQSLGVLSQR